MTRTSSTASASPPAAGRDADDSPRRDAILDAALDLFAERGFHGTAVPLVAERARVGAGTLYRYFASKEALVNALFQRWKAELGRALLPAATVAPNLPPRRLFHELWQALCGFATRHPKVVDFLELHHHGDYLDETSRGVERRLLEPVRAMVVEWQKKEAIKPVPPEVLMAVVWGGFLGLLRASRQGHLKLTDANLAAAESCLWEAIRL